ncbi:MAG TPA: DUF4810 domain-containing protein [Burkholderiaceae bacterium]|nr:DUF4810 domain-containing protein [Burkholderiaceae bacterium]
MKLLALAFVVLALAGCANQQHDRYDWAGYDQLLYQGYKDPSQMEAMRVALETAIGRLEQQNLKVAPGLYAELGTLYYQKGDSPKAVVLYEKERATWPESKGLMDSLISNINRRPQSPPKTEPKP